jgi:Flp pilus assembly pilin Flp
MTGKGGKALVVRLFMTARSFIRNERGSLSDMTWVVGSAVVVALIIVGLAITGGNGGLVGTTVRSMWSDAATWIQGQIGF